MIELFTGKKLIISAYTTSSEGGRMLLANFLDSLPSKLEVVCFVPEAHVPSSSNPMVRIVPCKSSVLHRLWTEYQLFKVARGDSVQLLSFNGLPPLFPIKTCVSIFIQNRYLVHKGDQLSHDLKFRVKLKVQQLWLKYLRRKRHKIIVQTTTMKKLILKAYPTIAPKKVEVRPFHSQIDPKVLSSLPNNYGSFLYIASFQRHKNHDALIAAWEILKENHALTPPLVLVSNSSELEEMLSTKQLNIRVVRTIERAELLKLIKTSSTIYPSLLESYGLPLVEASQLEAPILASNRSYVLDVCNPNLMFEPTDPTDIAYQVAHYLKSLSKQELANVE